MRVYKIIFLFFAMLLVSCEFLDDTIKTPVITACDSNAMVDPILYQQIQTTKYGITSVVLNGDCLEITVSSSGCDPNNWSMNLVTVPSTATVVPQLYHAKVELINDEVCLAVFQKTKSFDLTPLKIQSQNKIQVDIDGWNTPIIYSY